MCSHERNTNIVTLLVYNIWIMKYFVFDLRHTLTLTFISGQPHPKSCSCPWGICVQIICFGAFVKMSEKKNNDIYILFHLSAILNLCKLHNHTMERCGCVHKWTLKIFLNIITISRYWSIWLYNYWSLTLTWSWPWP